MLAVYCAGELGRTVVDSLRRGRSSFDDVVFLDDDESLYGVEVGGVPVVGGLDAIASISSAGTEMIVAYGAGPDTRIEIATRISTAGYDFVTVVDAESTVSDSATVDEGTYINAQSYVGPGAAIGRHVVVDSAVNISHDVELGDGTIVTPNATLAGDVCVGRYGYLGPGATVLRGRKIGESAVVGAGAVVTEDVPSGETVVGVPASPI